MMLNRWDEALVDAQHCIERQPSFVKGHCRLLQCLLQLKRFDEAKAALQRALQLDANNTDLRKFEQQLNAQLDAGSGSVLTDDFPEAITTFASQVFSELVSMWNFRADKNMLFRSKCYLMPSDPDEEQLVISIESAFQSPQTNLEVGRRVNERKRKE
jgi:tetratricopeptide (TPR) repeat protein